MSKKHESGMYFALNVLHHVTASGGHPAGLDKVAQAALKTAIWAKYVNLTHGNVHPINGDKLKAACEHFGLSFECSPDAYADACKAETEAARLKGKGGNVYTFANVSVLLDWQNNAANFDEFMAVQFLASLAVRSVVGKSSRKFAWLGWEFLLSRMDGRAKKAPIKQLPKWLAKYNSRKRRARLAAALGEYWGITYYAKRGLTPLWGLGLTVDELATIASQRKHKPKGGT